MKNETQTKCVSDAYCRYDADIMQWEFGTAALRLELVVSDGQLRLARLCNELAAPAINYVESSSRHGILPVLPGVCWKLEQQASEIAIEGGCRVLRLNLVFSASGLRLYFQIQAYPDTSILRLKADMENTDKTERVIQATLLDAGFFPGSTRAAALAWFSGGCAASGQGQIHRESIDANYNRTLEGTATDEFCPMLVFERDGLTGDGLMVALEYTGQWRSTVTRQEDGLVCLNMAMNSPDTLLPGQRVALPFIFLGAFKEGLDDLGVRLYDWQYRYLWDYTNPEYHARPRVTTWWFYTSRNLQEQFAARIANLDLLAEPASETGYEVLWDDAGWASHPGDVPPDSYGAVFTHAYEGPDFARTQRYLRKKGMKWILWFCGLPGNGVLTTKVGAWGDFEWRTDGMPCGTLTQDRHLRQRIERFLDTHPGSSFHTCSGGGRYMHTFEMQRYGNYHYLSDIGRGPAVNYYFSYFDTPDKSGDILESLASVYGNKNNGSMPGAPGGARFAAIDLKYVPETARNALTAVPSGYGIYAGAADKEQVRQDLELYRFLRHEGVAGRWSYVFHPIVEGAEDYQFFQRTSQDRRKACIIMKCRRPGMIRIYPRGLLPNERYAVSFAITPGIEERGGAELMKNGIVLQNFPARELIFLNLPNRPGSGFAVTPPQRPGSVYARFENNLGHSGVGIYWSPGHDECWISFYEVARNGQTIAKVSVGFHWFDHAEGWLKGHGYAVRTINGDGKASDWKEATWIAGEPLTFEALGGHFPVAGRDGWCAETSEDGKVFRPMAWVGPAADPSADLGGTPNQAGGVEGYWEGPSLARLGRGWQQASALAACVRTWIAPKAGRVRVVGRAIKEWYRRAMGEALLVRILCNDRQIWPSNSPEQPALVALNDLHGASHDFIVDVNAGDRIRFVLEKGSNPHADLLAWMPLITYVAETPIAAEESLLSVSCGARLASMAGDDAGRWMIDVSPGLYTVQLKFVEMEHAFSSEQPFHVEINGQRMLIDFDFTQAGQGAKRNRNKAFHYIAPDENGRIVIHFLGAGQNENPKLSTIVQAIEVLPEIRSCVRINAGSSEAFIDWNSFAWAGDQYYAGGTAIHSFLPVLQASPTLYDQPLYQTARCGHAFAYRIPVTPGLYTVHLKFAELWLAEDQCRAMGVEINSRVVLSNFDPATVAGQRGMSADMRFEMITPDADGFITVSISAKGEHEAILQALEIE